MAVTQISVLLGNVPGTLSRLTNILDREDITAKALLAASSAETSTVRMVVNDPDRAAAILESFGFNCEITPVLAAEVPLHPGGMNAILNPYPRRRSMSSTSTRRSTGSARKRSSSSASTRSKRRGRSSGRTGYT